MGKIRSPSKRVSKRKVESSPRVKKLRSRRMKIVKTQKRLRRNLRAINSSVRMDNFVEEKLKKIVLKLLGDETIEEIDGFVEEWEYFQDIDLIILGSSDEEYKEYTDLLREEYKSMDLENYHNMRSKENSSDDTQSINIPKAVAENITSKLSNLTCKAPHDVSNSHDDDCVIVDVTPASIICLDEIESENSLSHIKSDNNKSKSNENKDNVFHSPYKNSVSSFGDSASNNDPDENNSLFVIDSKPGFNGSKVPLYHSITSCAQSTPLRNCGGTDPKHSVIICDDSENKTIAVTSQSPRKNRCDSDVIFIQDEGESVISLLPQDSSVDQSVIFCGVQTIGTPIRRIETNTPTPNQNRPMNSVKRTRSGRKIISNRMKGNQCGVDSDTICETLQNSFKLPNTGGDKRIIIIDGCNVAFGHGNNKKFSAEGIEIALRYFERKGHETRIVVPQFRLRNQQSTNQALMHRLQDTDKLVVTPSKNLPGKMSTSYDDRFILQLAEEFDAAIISNDNYRDLLLENPAWKQIIETRVIGYTWLKDFFMLPTDPYGKTGPKLDEILNKKV